MVTISTLEAIVPAVKKALRVWIKDLPITSKKIWKALR